LWIGRESETARAGARNTKAAKTPPVAVLVDVAVADAAVSVAVSTVVVGSMRSRPTVISTKAKMQTAIKCAGCVVRVRILQLKGKSFR